MCELTLDQWLLEQAIAMHRRAERCWLPKRRRFRHILAAQYAERAIEARELREHALKYWPHTVADLEEAQLHRTIRYGT